jgi:ABC-type multidrug transport system fused ATPase/permease subunit
LLREPSVIVLDEPTSALDPITEQSMTTTLSTLLKGRTAIIITHRMSLVSLADQVIVLEGGKVSQIGTPQELLQSNGTLAAMFRAA